MRPIEVIRDGLKDLGSWHVQEDIPDPLCPWFRIITVTTEQAVDCEKRRKIEEGVSQSAISVFSCRLRWLHKNAPDPFGSSLIEALRREDAVIPHPVTRVEAEVEKDDLWRSIVEYGRGG